MKYQRKDLAQFPEQIRFAVSNYQPHKLRTHDIKNILLAGLGGSGIAGRIIKAYFSSIFPIPIEVVSDYSVPAFVDSDTLAILCSYSGNTEETLATYTSARERGARIISITTGGKLGEMTKNGNDLILKSVPGFQPRMALGYPLTYLFKIFAELTASDIDQQLINVAESLSNEEAFISKAKQLFNSFKAEYPKKLVIVGDALTTAIATRFSQQIEENAKDQAFVHELPEANHNVIESYYGDMNSIFIFLNSKLNERVNLRFQFLEELLKKNGNTVVNLPVEKNSISGLMQAIYTLDWLSLVIADYKGINSSKIENINALKEFLSKR